MDQLLGSRQFDFPGAAALQVNSLGVILATGAMATATACTTGHHSTVDMATPPRFRTQTCTPRPTKPTRTMGTSS
ncbi:Polyadenylate-binding protein RBP47B [Zea mays]|uniref:Polyadenylate-binding protein RBP47B n=1 Tax=Zea mays TaxID=4577 RepID=A0A1D6Q3J4_MAIZE|nr:Polyadenylate-binding protein RBP47B [Zea mays]